MSDYELRVVRDRTVYGHKRLYPESIDRDSRITSSPDFDPSIYPLCEYVMVEYDSAYDERNRLVWKRERWPEARLERLEKYEYDEQGRCCRVSFKEDDVLKWVRRFRYDAQGRLIKKTKEDARGNITSSVRYEYDAGSTAPREIVEHGEG